MDVYGQMAAATARWRANPQDETIGSPPPTGILQGLLDDSDEYTVPISFLRRGAEVARSIAMVSVHTDDGEYSATGFLVSPELMLTAGHALPSADAARKGSARFNYESLPDGSVAQAETFSFNPGGLFLTDEPLDYTLVAVSYRERPPGHDFGWCSLVNHPRYA